MNAMTRHRRSRMLLALVGAVTAVLIVTTGANAAPSCSTQQLTFGRYDPELGDFSLWSARLDGTHRIRLSRAVSWFSDWSPDRRTIAYDALDGADEHLHLTDPQGRHRRQLTFGPGIQEVPRWSPDGRLIAYDASDLTPDQEGFSTSIWVIHADGTRPRRLTTQGFDVEPDWSPDGRRIVFVRITGVNGAGVQQAGVWVMDADGSHQHQVAPARTGAQHPDWSPDGRWIAFTTEPGGAESILRVHPDGTGLSSLIPATARYQFYKSVWSADGDAILVGCNDLHSHVDKICRTDGQGRHVRLVIDETPTFVNYPSW